MHKWAKQIMECVKAKVEAIGLDSFEGQNLDDLKDFTEIAKNIACFDKDYRIVEAIMLLRLLEVLLVYLIGISQLSSICGITTKATNRYCIDIS